MSESIYDIQVTSLAGESHPLSAHEGKVLLIVNTASRCGLTPQYEALQQLQERYEDRGFRVLGFPCNQFGAQEPGSAEDIEQFCTTNYGVTFPLHSKIEVNGPGTHPLYRRLKEATRDKQDISWNFAKFLVDRNGHVVSRHDPQVDPLQLSDAIEVLLK